MKNELKYYYNLDIKKIIKKDNSYTFSDNNSSYIFTICDRNVEELEEIYELSNILIQNGIYCHEIILNNNHNILTNINNKNYILMKNIVCSNDKISLNDIIMFSFRTKNDWPFLKINRTNWQTLWLNKLQNLEYQISQLGYNKYVATHGFSYYAGIIENDIQLLREMSINNSLNTSICHKRITYETTLNEFYNPLNFIIDYSCRDVAEYLKSKIIHNIDVIEEYIYCLKLRYYNDDEKRMMLIRILFPSYQLDIYEKIFFQSNNSTKENMNSILINNLKYEQTIKKIYASSIAYIGNIPYINWLNLD